MNNTDTPNSTPTKDTFRIPPSPSMKTLGFGTGIRVYEVIRSPLANKSRSPWAIKKIIKKKMTKELQKRMNWEAEILRKLSHPNIVGFRAHIKSPNGDVLAMEECTTSLGDLIEEKRDNDDYTPYPLKTILKVGQDISSALNYLHNVAFILHCDIKSFNILVKNDFEINKLCDFGVSLPLNKNGKVDEERIGKEFEYIGTLAWLPPEVKDFPQVVTTKADIYSFGVVLGEMLTMTLPIENLDVSENSTTALDEFSNIVPDVDEEEYGIILEIKDKCTSHRLENRPDAVKLEEIFQEYSNLLQNE